MTAAPLAILTGRYAAMFRDGIAGAVTSRWEFLAAPDLPPQEGTASRAQVLISADFARDWPAMPNLRLLQVPTSGYDRVDLSALPPGVTVCNVHGHAPAVGEYALLGMLEWCHRLAVADGDMRAGDWSRSPKFAGALREELSGKTLLVVGLGRIGRAVARRAEAFDMRVVAANRTVRTSDPHVERVIGLEQLGKALGEADFVVLACALTVDTRGLIDARALAAMKPKAVIVNVARGPVIDEAALFDALSDRRIGGAVLDTWWDYPDRTPRDASARFPFQRLENVLMSPHFAGWTTGTMKRRVIEMARNLDRLACGEPLANVIANGANGHWEVEE